MPFKFCIGGEDFVMLVLMVIKLRWSKVKKSDEIFMLT